MDYMDLLVVAQSLVCNKIRMRRDWTLLGANPRANSSHKFTVFAISATDKQEVILRRSSRLSFWIVACRCTL